MYNLLLLHHLSFVFSFIEGCTIVETWWNTCFLNMYITTWRKWSSSSLGTDHFSWTDASWTSRCQSAFRLNDPLYSLLKIHSERVYLYFSLFLIFFFYAWVLKLMLQYFDKKKCILLATNQLIGLAYLWGNKKQYSHLSLIILIIMCIFYFISLSEMELSSQESAVKVKFTVCVSRE